jgi:CYTH domain-containing protein
LAQEIERRFLVQNLEKGLPSPNRIIKIEQGYYELGDINKSFRVRICDGSDAYLTMKFGKGQVREEIESPVNLDFARQLMRGCNHRLNKNRWLIDGWEIDLYEPPLRGVIIAEKELASVHENLVIPPWLKGVIEVTDTLTNHHLARLASDLEGTDVVAMPYLSSHIFGNIPRVVLTGGPCSGKSTIIEIIKNEMPEIHCVPEMATIVIRQFGIIPSTDPIENRRFQRMIYRAQRIFEATSTQFAIQHSSQFPRVKEGSYSIEARPMGQPIFREVFRNSKRS